MPVMMTLISGMPNYLMISSVQSSNMFISHHQRLRGSNNEFATAELLQAKRKGMLFIMPLVVIPDDALWIAEYDFDGKFVSGPTQTDSCTYFVNYELEKVGVMPLVISHVHFVTCTGLKTLIFDLMKSQSPTWDEILK